MVYVHYGRPMILTPEHAPEWMDPATTVEQAKELLSVARPESAFERYEVARKVRNSRYQGKDASEPIPRLI